MKTKFITLFAIALYLASQIAFAQKSKELNCKGEVTFKVKNAGIDVTGTIDISDLQVNFDEKNLAQSHVVAIADPNKINTGINIRDNHLRRTDFFDVIHYPTIKLQSTAFRKAGKVFEGQFDLTIKNLTKRVVAYFSRKETGNMVIFNGSFVINRRDFHIGEDSAILSELVTVYFSIICDKGNKPE